MADLDYIYEPTFTYYGDEPEEPDYEEDYEDEDDCYDELDDDEDM